MLDSTAAVAAEHQGKNARQLLEAIVPETVDAGIALTVLTVLELAHGISRADSAEAGNTGNVPSTICSRVSPFSR